MKNSINNSSLLLTSLGLIMLPTVSAVKKEPTKIKPNILFISVDDLKPITKAYGDKIAITPGMDRLAKEGITFKNCYVQQAVSGPTRASIMTGMRPDKTKVWDLDTDFRQVNPNAVSIQQHFIQNGYESVGIGKIYHEASIGPGHDAPSWSVPYVKVNAKNYALATGDDFPSIECADVPDNIYKDGMVAEESIKLLQKLKNSSKPFILSLGFAKPHLPFVAPKKYWDLYKREQFKVAPFQQMALNSPNLAYHEAGEIKHYSDIPKFNNYSENELDHLSDEKQLELMHGYYAATSYMDAQLLRVLNELDRLKLSENTIVVLWGDHGWHLGDHGIWCKHSNFEEATHACFFMRVNGMKKNIKPITQCEFVDIFPTLCELASIPTPTYLDGISLVPAIKKPKLELREYALSQYPRGTRMGYSIRTKRYRYTAWIDNSYSAEKPFSEAKIIATEMYDYKTDSLETKSVVGDKQYAQDEASMKLLFEEAMEREHEEFKNYAKLANFQAPIKKQELNWLRK